MKDSSEIDLKDRLNGLNIIFKLLFDIYQDNC